MQKRQRQIHKLQKETLTVRRTNTTRHHMTQQNSISEHDDVLMKIERFSTCSSLQKKYRRCQRTTIMGHVKQNWIVYNQKTHLRRRLQWLPMCRQNRVHDTSHCVLPRNLNKHMLVVGSVFTPHPSRYAHISVLLLHQKKDTSWLKSRVSDATTNTLRVSTFLGFTYQNGTSRILPCTFRTLGSKQD